MTTPQTVVNQIIPHKTLDMQTAQAFAPSNIALVKYWGKRDEALKLATNPSLSISLGHKGATTTITVNNNPKDQFLFSNQILSDDNKHYHRLKNYFDLFRPDNTFFNVTIDLNIPFAAGLASSACVFASIVCALDKLFNWQLPSSQLSILARLGSGSAARSIEHGFIEWLLGDRDDGMDSYGKRLNINWPKLRIGLCILSKSPKKIGSSAGMKLTCETSPLYSSWPKAATKDLAALKNALAENSFETLGLISEQNALMMHATMLASRPTILYTNTDTLSLMNQVWALREQGHHIYFTQDAGPNLKLIFENESEDIVKSSFKGIDIIAPFTGTTA